MKVRSNGADIKVEVAGEGTNLLLLHGFMGSSQSWTPVLPKLRRHHRCICLDLVGHGRSDGPADAERYSVTNQMADVLEVLDRLYVGQCALLGYSMGGRIALHLVLAHPGRFSALICESASPGIDDSEDRERRRHEDDELAAVIESRGVEAFVEQWENLELFQTQKSLPSDEREKLRFQRLQTPPEGAAGSLRGMSPGRCDSVWGSLPHINLPVLLIAGEHDLRYESIAERMSRVIPQSEMWLAPGAGHAVHLEQPTSFTDVVLDFLRRQNRLQRSKTYGVAGLAQEA